MEQETVSVRELSLAGFIWMMTGKKPRIVREGYKRCVFVFEGDSSIFEEYYKSDIPKHKEFIKQLIRMVQDLEKENGNG